MSPGYASRVVVEVQRVAKHDFSRFYIGAPIFGGRKLFSVCPLSTSAFLSSASWGRTDLVIVCSPPLDSTLAGLLTQT